MAKWILKLFDIQSTVHCDIFLQ